MVVFGSFVLLKEFIVMLSVLIASGLGAAFRYVVERFNPTFPIATLLINVGGSFIAGFAVAVDIQVSSALLAFAGTFTTFSGLIAGTRALSTLSRVHAFVYGHGSIALSVIAAWIGLSLG